MKKKILLSILALSLAATAAAPVFSNTDTYTSTEENSSYDVYTTRSFTAVSVENELISCTDENGNEAIIDTTGAPIYSSDAQALSIEDIKEGDELTMYILSVKPMTLQLPETYNADAVIVNVENGFFTDADEYAESEDMLVNSAGTLALKISEDTKIIDEYGESCELASNLLVFYGASTKSIPAQTTPELIVVLYDEEIAEPDFNGVSSAIIGDVQIDFNAVTINGKAMLPLRSISEALGYEVEWNPDGTIRLGNAYTLTVGEDSYIHAKLMADSLGQAPVIINFGDTSPCYVPAEFYTEILGDDVYVENNTAVFSVD